MDMPGDTGIKQRCFATMQVSIGNANAGRGARRMGHLIRAKRKHLAGVTLSMWSWGPAVCEVGARCPACGTDLAPYETYCGRTWNGATYAPLDTFTRPHHRFECECGTAVEVTEPLPGLVMTRQDAEYRP